MPQPTGDLTVEKKEVAQELDYDHDELADVAESNESSLNKEQLEFWLSLKEGIDTESGDLFALQAQFLDLSCVLLSVCKCM